LNIRFQRTSSVCHHSDHIFSVRHEKKMPCSWNDARVADRLGGQSGVLFAMDMQDFRGLCGGAGKVQGVPDDEFILRALQGILTSERKISLTRNATNRPKPDRTTFGKSRKILAASFRENAISALDLIPDTTTTFSA
jgi:hypothetical protein